MCAFVVKTKCTVKGCVCSYVDRRSMESHAKKPHQFCSCGWVGISQSAHAGQWTRRGGSDVKHHRIDAPKPERAPAKTADFHLARPGCCAGCATCMGMQINCHQDPCRCDRVCSCDFTKADEGGWQEGCDRHDMRDDTRRFDEFRIHDVLIGRVLGDETTECPVCGVKGACGFDAERRPLIHADHEGLVTT